LKRKKIKDARKTVYSEKGHPDTLLRKDLKTNKPLVYPPVVIAHITKDITYLFLSKIKSKQSIQVHYSAQMNSHPHLGSILSLMTAFATTEKLSNRFEIPSKIKFEVLENAPKEQEIINGLVYAKMHCDTYVDNVPLSSIYLKSFKELLDMLKLKTGIEYELLYYKQFQEIPFVRKTLIEMIDREKEFVPIVSPSEGHLRIRIPCPKCKFSEKSGVKTKIKKSKHKLTLSSDCPNHGTFEIELKENNKDFIDMNTPIRNIIKEAMFIDDARAENALNLMVDGCDWVHMAEFIVAEGLSLLGYNYADRPTRLFTPIIEDWSGAKFSKSVYTQKGTYNNLPEGFLNYIEFKKRYGSEGLEKLWEEAKSWILDSKKLFRNYSAEYLMYVLHK
jgi:ssDNA-binding Zn-finger/Zn-ribbon topoisomerase 1